MRIFAALSSSVFLLQIGSVLCQSASSSLPSSADILYWPVTSSQPSLLAKIEYDLKTLDTNVLSYTPPSSSVDTEGSSSNNNNNNNDDLVRVGFFIDSSKRQWVGSLISRSALAAQRQKLHLYLGQQQQAYHASLSPHFNQSGPDAAALDVELVLSKPGSLPELNKPVVINPDGTAPEVVEKTFFQKYWWVFLLVTFLAMSGGGGEGGQQ